MPTRCTICRHPRRDEIDLDILRGKPLLEIKRETGLSHTSLRRHRDRHIAESLKLAHNAQDVARADVLLAEVQRLDDEAKKLQQQAEEKGDQRGAIAALRERREILALKAKMSGQVGPTSQTNILNVVQLPEETARRMAETFLSRRRALAR